ncbi:MAG: DUF1961 family protein [Puniceicoccales bacterium]
MKSKLILGERTEGTQFKRIQGSEIDPRTLPTRGLPLGVFGEVKEANEKEGVLDFPLEARARDEGWIELDFYLPVPYLNGELQSPSLVVLFEMPGFGRFLLGLPDDRVAVLLIWQRFDLEEGDQAPLIVNIPELPGPERYHILFTWQAERGISSLYLNGVSTTDPDVPKLSWEIGQCDRIRLRPQFFHYHRVEIGRNFLPYTDAPSRCPVELKQLHSDLLDKRLSINPMDTKARKGKLLYSNNLASSTDFSHWLVDAGKVEFTGGWCRVASEDPEATSPDLGHTTFWCPFHTPDSFLLEWETRVVREGLMIVFFAAKGEKGESPYNPSLPIRKGKGKFLYYIKDRLLSYHASYHTQGRGISNLRKNNRFWLLATGTAGIPNESKAVHSVRVIKDRGHIQLAVDGELTLDCRDDDEKRYGPRHMDGWIGFRQMRPGVADYRNVRIWELR